jgi:O-methyltransferase involved in polyketide biosynthesis
MCSTSSSGSWLAEGLLIYLSAEQAVGLLAAVGALSAPGSQLAFEHGGMAADSLTATASTMPAMAEYTALWQGGLGADAPNWLAGHGWRVHGHDRATLAVDYGRPDPDVAGGSFLTAVRT